MKHAHCVDFLQACLPELGYRWKGFRKVRNQVCKRIRLRIGELNLSDFSDYERYLASHKEEWDILDALCYVTISRFYRDRKIFDTLESEILPALAEKAAGRDRPRVRCWSAGCCSGEEPYTLRLIWDEACRLKNLSGLSCTIIATERNEDLIARATAGFYPAGSLKELSEDLISKAFVAEKGGFRLKNEYKSGILFERQDIRQQLPEDDFDLILCRNLVFTYFSEDLQRGLLSKIVNKLRPGGFLIIGAHESFPGEIEGLAVYHQHRSIFQKG